jgi:hypothetical protein
MIRKKTTPRPAWATGLAALMPTRAKNATAAVTEDRHRGPRRMRRGGVRRRLRAAAASLLALAILSLGLSAPAHADGASLTFVYESSIDTTPVGGGPGTPLRIFYTFDTSLAPGSGSFGTSETLASYGPLDRMIVMVGDQCVALSGAGTEITVFNNAGTTSVEDSYDVRAFGPATAGKTLFGLNLRFARFLLVDSEATMFTDTSLPTTPTFGGAAEFQQATVDLVDQTGFPVRLRVDDFSPFFLSVYDPVAQIETFKSVALGLDKGLSTALLVPLEKAIGYLSDASTSNDRKAIQELQTFIAKANAAGLTKVALKMRSLIDSLPVC